MTTLELTASDRALLEGDSGPAPAIAMRFIVMLGEGLGATHLIDITRAHVDGCLYHGAVGLDFAQRLLDAGATVTVPTTLNVGALDLLHPELFRGDPEIARRGKRQMAVYEAMGCLPTWTCAPYQLTDRPAFGEQIAWAESNAIVFANSVIGARTNRYGDFIDICAAITGRVPAHGYHLDEARLATLVVELTSVPAALRRRDDFFPVLGHLLGRLAGSSVPVITGLDDATEDQLKGLGAAAASSGAVALFHVAGVTPEAATVAAALGNRAPARTITITTDDLRQAREELSTATRGPLRAVCLGTPHASAPELSRIAQLLAGRRIADGLGCFVSTGRDTAREMPEVIAALEDSGVVLVYDTCTYVAPVLEDGDGPVMTDSAKWAYYAPANLGADVVFGSTADCVASAVVGEVSEASEVWHG